MALEKLNGLKKYHIDKNTTMITDSVFVCQKKVFKDKTIQQSHFPTPIILFVNRLPKLLNIYFLACDHFKMRD